MTTNKIVDRNICRRKESTVPVDEPHNLNKECLNIIKSRGIYNKRCTMTNNLNTSA